MNTRHRLVLGALLGAAAPLFCQQASSGAWWRDTHVVTLSSSPPSLEDLVTVIGWGETAESADGAAYLRRRVQREHNFGRKIAGSMSIYDAAWETYQRRPELAAAAVVDIDGRPMTVEWESVPGRPLPWANTNSPVWQEFFLDQARRLVDAGVDAVVLDEIDGTAGSVGRGGSFGEPDMSLFRAYLAARYTPQQLSARFGIDNIAAFHYASYIRSRGLAGLWRTEPWRVPLSREFTRFQREASVAFLSRLVATTRNYAAKQYGRTIAFTANLYGFYPNLVEYAALMDYFTTELAVSENGYPGGDHVILDHKMARALGGKPAWGLLSVGTVADLKPRGPMTNLIRLLIAESYAAGGGLILPYLNYGWSPAAGPVWFVGDSPSQRPYYAFFKQNAALFNGRTPHSNVALLYSQATESERWEQYRASYRGAAMALLDSQTQFDVVPLGAGSGLPEWPGDQRMAAYPAAVLPAAACLSSTQADRLLEWTRRGNTLVILGETGTCNLLGETASVPALTPFAAAGTHVSGSGKVIRFTDDPGAAYRRNRAQATRDRIAAAVRTASPAWITVEGGAGLVVLADRARNGAALMLHLVNGNYRLAGDALVEAGAARIRVTLPAPLANAAGLRAYHLSPDRQAPAAIPVTPVPGGVLLDCPPVRLYDTVVVTTAAGARAIAAPAAQDLLTAAVESVRRGGDLDVLTPLRSQLEAARAADNELLAGWLAGSATAQLRQSARARVLVDESHNQRLTLSVLRASTIGSGDPNSVLVERARQALGGEFVFESNESAPLTAALLGRYDALLLAAPRTALAPAEAAAVDAYVQAGGGLVVLTGCGTETAIPSAVTLPYGIAFESACVFDTADGGTWDIFHEEVAADPAMAGVSHLSANAGGSLAVTAPARTLIRSSRTTWADVTRDRVWTPDEPNGPFAVAAAAEPGSGRVIAASSRTFQDAGSDFYANDSFLAAALRWVARPPQGSSPATVSAASLRPGPVAPDMIASSYGGALALQSQVSTRPQDALGGTTVRILDEQLRESSAPLFSVAPDRVTWLAPGWLDTGSAAVIIRNADGLSSASVVPVASVAPGLFSANGTGTGVAAGTVLRIAGGAAQPRQEPLAVPGESSYVAVPVGFGPESERLYLSLTATGLRHATAATGAIRVSVGGQDVPVAQTAGSAELPGVDLLDVGPLPRSLAGKGRVEVVVSVDGQPANPVSVTFQ